MKMQFERIDEKFGMLMRLNQRLRNVMHSQSFPNPLLEEIKENVSTLRTLIQYPDNSNIEEKQTVALYQQAKGELENSKLELANMLSTSLSETQSLNPQKCALEKNATEVAIAEKLPAKKCSQIPQIAHLTEDECSNIPKYMKGRLTLVKINSFVDEFNKSLSAKYKIVRTPRSQLGEILMKKYRKFKSQECDASYGLFFCTDEDLKDFSNLKADNAFRSCIVILRHLSRLRDVRWGSLFLHCVI